MKLSQWILTSLFTSLIPAFGQVPSARHVVIVVEENHSYTSVLGNPAMPYLNGLAQSYSLSTQYFADTHPSIGNYFMLTTGQIISNNDGFPGPTNADNLVRQFAASGVTWKSYAEGLPSIGYLGGDTGLYFKHHNPFAYFSDVVNSASERQNLVPFSEFASDLASNHLPEYSFIIPNACNDAHNCSLATADTWLKTNIAPLLSNAQFQTDGLLLIVFDEAAYTDTTHGGGHVFMVAAGPTLKQGYQSTAVYQHENLLRTVCSALSLSSCPGAGASAAPMSDLFRVGKLPPIAILTVTPQTGNHPLTITADASKSYDGDDSIVGRTINFGDGTKIYWTPVVSHTYNKPGSYDVVLTLKDASGLLSSAQAVVTVQ